MKIYDMHIHAEGAEADPSALIENLEKAGIYGGTVISVRPKESYGKIKMDSSIYELLGFKKTESDQVEELKKVVPQNQLEAFFEEELRRRYGISSADLSEHFGVSASKSQVPEHYEGLVFPTAFIKNWDALKKHAAEMLIYANPVKYDYAVRRIRVSDRSKESRAYLKNMYRYDGQHKYACQMCHDACSNIESVEIFNKPETELDPMNICLCPNCAMLYRQIRNDIEVMNTLKNRIMALRDYEMTGSEHVDLIVDGQELWFTHVHIAEIQALLQLEKEASQKTTEPECLSNTKNDGKNETGLSVYSKYKGKIVKRKDGFEGEVVGLENEYLVIKIIKEPIKGIYNGPKVGDNTKIQLSFVIEHPNVYIFEEK
ncbi:MAG: hypothetical protein IJE40_05345 [Clostridia bacterium]|nr:hypothetical protein [Clostridia bacterium]